MSDVLVKTECLFAAIQENRYTDAEKLLKEGANPNRLLLNGVTPFHISIRAHSSSSYDYISLILAHNGNPNVRSSDGLTPLHVAAIWGKADCLDLLLKNGADITLCDKYGRDVMWFSRENANCKVILEAYIADVHDSHNDSCSLSGFTVNSRGKIAVGSSPFENNENKNFKCSKNFIQKPFKCLPSSNSVSKINNYLSNDDKDSITKGLSNGMTNVALENDKISDSNHVVTSQQPERCKFSIDATSPDHCVFLVKPDKKTEDRTVMYDTMIIRSAEDSTSDESSINCVSPSVKTNNVFYSEKIDATSVAPEKGAESFSNFVTPSSVTTILHDTPKSSQHSVPFLSEDQAKKMLMGTKVNLEPCYERLSDSDTTKRLVKETTPANSNKGNHSVQTNDVFYSEKIDATSVAPDDGAESFSNCVTSSSVTTIFDDTPKSSQHSVPFLSEEQAKKMLMGTKVNLEPCYERLSDGDTTKCLVKENTPSKMDSFVANISFYSAGDSTIPVDGPVSPPEKNEKGLDTDSLFDNLQQVSDNVQESHHSILESTNLSNHPTRFSSQHFDISKIPDGDQVYFHSIDCDGNSLIEHVRSPALSFSSDRGKENSLPIKLSVSGDLSNDNTIIYDWKSLDESMEEVSHSYDESILHIPHNIQALSDAEVRKELIKHGENPGPIRCARQAYRKRLCLLEQGHKFHKPKSCYFSHELQSVILGKPLPKSVVSDDSALRQHFDDPRASQDLRGGTAKDCFNYLLLDPRVTQNLPARAKVLTEAESLKIFAGAIFYVGKGKKSRPYAHFKEAIQAKSKTSKSRKMQHIHEIWENECGVISLHVFQNILSSEALTREATMIEALGLDHLTNHIRGTRYGSAASWNGSRVREYGTFLVLSAMQILLWEGERQIRPHQVSNKKRKD